MLGRPGPAAEGRGGSGEPGQKFPEGSCRNNRGGGRRKYHISHGNCRFSICFVRDGCTMYPQFAKDKSAAFWWCWLAPQGTSRRAGRQLSPLLLLLLHLLRGSFQRVSPVVENCTRCHAATPALAKLPDSNCSMADNMKFMFREDFQFQHKFNVHAQPSALDNVHDF